MLANFQKTTAFSAHLFSALSICAFIILHSYKFWGEWDVFNRIFIFIHFVVIYIYAGYLNEKLLDFKLININNYLPQILSIYFLSIPPINITYFLLIAASLTTLVVIFELFNLYNTSGNHINVFGLSLVIGTLGLISPSFWSLFIYLIVIVFWVKTTNIKDVIALIMGYIYPYFILFTLSYLLSDYYLIKHIGSQINFSLLSIPSSFGLTEISLLIFIYLNIYAFLKNNTKQSGMVHKSRLIFRIFSFYFIISPLLFLINKNYSLQHFLPILWGGIGAFFINNFLIGIPKKWIQNFWLYLFFVACIVMALLI